MPWRFENPLVRVQTDGHGHRRIIRHLQYPFPALDADETPRVLAGRYLATLVEPLRIPRAAVEHLLADPGRLEDDGESVAEPGLRLRWKSGFEIREESIVVLVQQTHSGQWRKGQPLDVEGAGLRIMLRRGAAGTALAITSVTSTLEYQEIKLPAESLPKKAFSFETTNDVLASFGLPPVAPTLHADGPSLPFVHRFVDADLATGTSGANRREHPEPGRFYPARSIRLTIPPTDERSPSGPYDLTYWPVYVPDADGKPDIVPLRLIALSAFASPPVTGTGEVFKVDPITATGDFRHARRNSSPAHLDTHKQAVDLPNLLPPNPGAPWTLTGKNVVVLDPPVKGSIGIRPPSNRKAPIFKYGARTNNFAAVNLYYHIETLCGLLDRFGLPFETFPMKYQLPLQAIHRAAIQPGNCHDGKCINAQALWATTAGGAPTVQFRFALADLQREPGSVETEVEPLGIACDLRIVWHEFCHALIAAATDQIEFPFSHSAGDSLAAIQCDPDSALGTTAFPAEYRGVTFPWGTAPARCHDRDAADGWSWTKPLQHPDEYHHDSRDMFGYVREQILSSTLFRLYRAMGGDQTDIATHEPDPAARRAAADDATYLIISAIFAAGPAKTVPVQDAAAFATLLMHADVHTSQFPPSATGTPGHPGGAVHKVIEWAFTEQGLPPLPTSTGTAADDVFVGQWTGYGFESDWTAPATAIWNRLAPDGVMDDQTPVAGTDNYLYLAIGTTSAAPVPGVSVTVHQAPASQAGSWPNAAAWQTLPAIGTAAPAAVVGPFVWHPAVAGDYAMLARVEAPSDLSNINPAGGLPCAKLPTSTELLVRLDNNLGLRIFAVPQ